jgi:hypothetical protein
MNPIRFVVFGFGVFISALNFYLSFVRYPLFRLRGRAAEYRNVSGFPFIGSVAVLFALIGFQFSLWAWIVGILVAALDTGGPHWFIASVVWQLRKGGAASGRKGCRHVARKHSGGLD